MRRVGEDKKMVEGIFCFFGVGVVLGSILEI